MSSSDYSLSYEEATRVDCDRIFEQTETTYDPAGNVISMVSRQRLHDATGTGPLSTPAGSQPKARVSYAAQWYDAVGRQKASANYGTNDGTAPTRPSSAPASSDTVLVSTTQYNARGEADTTTDPAGREDRAFFDDAGRVTKTVQNYVDGTVSAAAPDEDVTIETTYNADGQVSTLTAKNPTTGDQVTQYVYGTATGGITPQIYRNDLLRAEIYPDSDDTTDLTDGVDGVYDRVEMKYNRQGQLIERKDQNQTVHAFSFDALGRMTEDQVTAFGDSVDQRVVAIGRTYEVRGMLETITSYENADSSSSSSGRMVLNQVKRTYNTFGQLAAEYQEHDGAVDTQTTPKVEYAYSDGSANHARPIRMTYPNGRVLRYEYDGSDDDALGRISCLADDSSGSVGTRLAQYTRLGLNSIVQVDYTEPDLRYDLAHGAGDDPYDGLDRFGRVVDLLWRDYGASADAVRIKHGYDRAGNRLWREDPVAAGYGKDLDELYAYDGVYQLASLERGDLNAAKDGLVAGSKTFAEDWSLDMTGNWKGYKKDDDGDGSWDLDQTRTHNAVNEITDIDASVGQIWISPTHDRAGNMLRIPQPGDPTRQFALAWDAWNRMVRVSSGGQSSSSSSSGSEYSVVAEYDYDGRMRRIGKTVYGEDDSSSSSSTGTGSEIRHFYYTDRWQCVEERLDAATAADRQFVWGLRYVDDLVIRDRDLDAGGSLGKPGSGLDERLYAMQDPNWNVVALSDQLGAVQERYAYAAYGRITMFGPDTGGQLGQQITASALDNRYTYTGRRLDDETRLYYYRARYCDAELGRFVGRDPVYSTPNLYAYCGNDPLDATDPTGLKIKHTFRKNVPDNLKEQTRKNFDKALDDLTKAGGLAADLARVLKESAHEWEVIWDMDAAPMQQGGRGGFRPSQKWLKLNPQWPTFIKPGSLPAAEEKGVTGAVVVGHELGHLILGLKDPANVTLVENEIRKLLDPKNPNPRPAYSGQPIPNKADIPKMDAPGETQKGVRRMVSPDEYIRLRLEEYLKEIRKHKSADSGVSFNLPLICSSES